MAHTFQTPGNVELGELLGIHPQLACTQMALFCLIIIAVSQSMIPMSRQAEDTVRHTWTFCFIWLNPKCVLSSPYFCANKNAKGLPSLCCPFPQVLVNTCSPGRHWFHAFHYPETSQPRSINRYSTLSVQPFNKSRCLYPSKWCIQPMHMPLCNTRLRQSYLQLYSPCHSVSANQLVSRIHLYSVHWYT